MQSAARLRVDLGALAANYRQLAVLAAPSQCAAVVKANAYGIGLEPALSALDKAGCNVFFVATPDEGARCRAHLPEAEVYILDGLLDGNAEQMAALQLRPVLGCLEEVEEWTQHIPEGTKAAPCALHIDTGMNRLGLMADDVKRLKAQDDLWQKLNTSLIISHLACGDTPAHPMNEYQLVQFERQRHRLPAAPASLANSAGMFLGKSYHFDLCRPGIALYGGEAVNHAPNPMAPVVRAEVKILQVKEIRAGSVGYGAAYHCRKPKRIATLAAGYADGFLRHLGREDGASDGACVYLDGQAAPIIGRVSMDLITVDVSHLDPMLAQRGAWAEIIGPNAPVDQVARWAGTIGYEVLTSLGKRYERVYVA